MAVGNFYHREVMRDRPIHYFRFNDSGYAHQMRVMGPLAYWRLNEASGSPVDFTGGGLSLTATGTVTRSQASNLGDSDYCVSVANGADNYLYSASATLKPTSAVSFIIRIRPSATGMGLALGYIGGAGGTGSHGYALWSETGKITWKIGTGSEQRLTTVATVLATDTWAEVCGTYDGATMKIYVDGALVDSVAKTGSVSYTGITNFCVGNLDGGSTTRNWDGRLDEPAVFDRALSAAEVAAIYARRNDTRSENSRAGRDWAGSVPLTLRNGPLTRQTGPLTDDSEGYAISFDGSDDVGYFGADVTLNYTNGFTLEAWIKPDSSQNDTYGTIFGVSGGAWGFYWRKDTTKLWGPGAFANNTALAAGSWYHVVARVAAGGLCTFFVNGSSDGAPGSLGSNLTLNRIGDVGTEGFKGLIAEVAVYNYALSNARIKAHYDAAAGSDNLWWKLEHRLSSSSLRRLMVASGAAGVWPGDNMFSSTLVDATGNGRNGTSSSVSRGDPSMLPEYGTITSFSNGNNGYFSVAHAAALAPASTFAFGTMFRARGETTSLVPTQTIIRKENGGTGGRLAMYIGGTTAVPTIVVEANIGASNRVLTYTIEDPYDWKYRSRFLLARYNGSTLALIQIAENGLVTTLASASYSGVVAAGTGTAIYFGSNSGSSEYLTGNLQMCGWWTDDYPSDAELLAFAEVIRWYDLTEDVKDISLSVGDRNSTPSSSRLARTGSMTYRMRNDNGNTGGLVGYYSPGHANCRSGFEENNMARLIQVSPYSPYANYTRFIGRVDAVVTRPGILGLGGVDVTALDFMDELARATLPAIANTAGDDGVGVRIDEAINKTVNALLRRPHEIRSTGTANSFQFGIDTADARTTAMQEVAAIADSELGKVFISGGEWEEVSSQNRAGGILRVMSRAGLQLDTDADFTLTQDELSAITVTRTRGSVYSKVQVEVTPRQVADVAATAILYTLDITETVPSLGPGESMTIRCPFTNAAESNRPPCGGQDVQNPTVTTDYTANSAEDGSGSDLSASLTVAYAGEESSAGANVAVLKITNTHATSTAYIRKLQLRGKRVLALQSQQCEAWDDTVRQAIGEVVLTVRQPYQDSVEVGMGAANYLLNAWNTGTTFPESLSWLASVSSTQTMKDTTTAVDMGDLIDVTDSVSGVSGIFRVIGLEMKYLPGWLIDVAVYLERREGEDVWIMGDSAVGDGMVAF